MVKEYQKVNRYMALGGLVRTQTNEILRVIEKVNEIRNSWTGKIHIWSQGPILLRNSLN